MRLKYVFGWVVGIIVFGSLLVFTPVSYKRVITEGTDSYSTHGALSGSKHIQQSVSLERDITGVGALLVNLKRAPSLASVYMRVSRQNGELLTEAVIPSSAIVDDTFAWVDIPRVSAQEGVVIIDVSSPDATAANAVGIRFEKEGDKRFAVGVIEKMSLRSRLSIWVHDHPEAYKRLRAGTQVALTMLILGTLLYEFKVSQWKYGWIGMLALLALFALWIRLPLLQQVEGIFGGDAYNHLLKTRAWIQGDDPFSSDFRKGPFFSVLLAPGLATSDPLLWGRWMSLLSAVAAVVLVAMLARGVGLPAEVAILGGALLAVLREFRFESVSSLSNLTYAALVVGTAVAFVYAHRKRMAYVMSVLGGLTTLTRYEGVLVPAVFLPAVWLYHQFRIRFIGYTLVPIVLLLLIPFSLWPITGQIGVRTPSDIKGDTGLSLALSWYEFKSNALQLKTILGLEWFMTPLTGRQFFALGVGGLAGLLIGIFQWRWPKLSRDILAVSPWLCLMWIVVVIIRDYQDTLKLLTLGMSFFAGAGGGWLAVRKPRYGIPLLLVVVLQGVAVTAILPKPRYYIHLLPFLVMGMVAIISGVTEWKWRWSRVGTFLFIGLVIGLVWYDGNDALSGMISDYNSKAYQSALMERAAKSLQQKEGDIGIITDDLPFRIFAGDDRLKLYRFREGENKATADEQLAWIREVGVAYVVEASFEPLFSVVTERPDLFEQQGNFTSRFHSGNVAVYKVK